MKKFLGLKIQIGGFSVGEEVVIITKKKFLNALGVATDMFGLRGNITKIENGIYTVNTSNETFTLTTWDIVSTQDYESNKQQFLESKRKYDEEMAHTIEYDEEMAALESFDTRLLTPSSSKWKPPLTKTTVAAPESESSLSFLSPIKQTEATSLQQFVPLQSPSGSTKIQGSMIGSRYRNKFTGKEGMIILNIEPTAWLCEEENETVCLWEQEMVSLDQRPFITNFRGDSEIIKATGNKSLDFIKEVMNDYVTRCVRLSLEHKFISDSEIEIIGKECSKPFANRHYSNLNKIEPLKILFDRLNKIMAAMESWLDHENWFLLKGHYDNKIRTKGGFMYNRQSFSLYIAEAFYIRIVGIKKLYESETYLSYVYDNKK